MPGTTLCSCELNSFSCNRKTISSFDVHGAARRTVEYVGYSTVSPAPVVKVTNLRQYRVNLTPHTALSNDLHRAPLLDQYEEFQDDFEADPDAAPVHEHDSGHAFGDEDDSEHDDHDDVSEDERTDDDETYENRGAWDRRH